MTGRWTYDGSIARFPAKPGEAWQCQRGTVMVHDLYRGLPDFMTAADCVFVDPPYGLAAENSYRTKAGARGRSVSYEGFLGALFRAIDRIAPATLFVECGAALAAITRGLAARFAHVERYRSTYYRTHPCWIVRGGGTPSPFDYSGLDELAVIDEVCRREAFATIADPCIGRGAVAVAAWRHHRRFAGTELAPARLAVLLNRVHEMGGEWHVDGARFEPQPRQPGDLGAGREGVQQQL